MIKITLLIISAIFTATACVWFVQHDGHVDIEWLGYNIEISVALLILAILVITLVLFIFTSAIFWLIRVPSNLKQKINHRTKEKGFESLARGFVAIAEGDTGKAKLYSEQARKKLKNISAIDLLKAQIYQLEGDSAQAKSHYNILLENKNTEIIGVKGLVLQAEKEDNFKEAIYLAERAKKRDSKLEWVNKLLLRLYKITHNWHKAQIILGDLVKFKTVAKQDVVKENAILNLAIAYDYNQQSDPEVALKYAKKAFTVLDDYLPAIYGYAFLLLKIEAKNKAKKTIEASWANTPNEHLADLYMQILSELPPVKQLKIVKKLVKINPKSIESHYAVAKAAFAVNELDLARNHLETALLIKESRKLYQLLINIETKAGASENKINNLKIKALTLAPDSDWQSCDEDLICGKWLPSKKEASEGSSNSANIGSEINLNQIDADKYFLDHEKISEDDENDQPFMLENLKPATIEEDKIEGEESQTDQKTSDPEPVKQEPKA